MDNMGSNSMKAGVRLVVVLALFGVCFYAFEHWGEGAMGRFSTYVSDQGRLGVVVFIAANALATMFLVPQGVFTVAAGALFGWKFGTAWAGIGMTAGAVGSFFLARYGVRDWLKRRFRDNPVFIKMQRLSVTHPLHVISLSRIIPVIPFPLASYMLGVTEVRSVPYALLTWLCMLPETLFLASGGHLLHAGITGGRASVEAGVALGVAAVAVGILIHRVKKRVFEESDA